MSPIATMLTLTFLATTLAAQEVQETRTVHAKVQARPGAPLSEFDMPVHTVPVDPPLIGAKDARLGEDELVLGIEHDGQTVAFPIRYLALYEVVNSRVGKLPVAPTW